MTAAGATGGGWGWGDGGAELWPCLQSYLTLGLKLTADMRRE